MKLVQLMTAILITTSLFGCATGLSSFEKRELKEYDAKGYKIEEKNEATAMWLGLLPGGGSFYTGHPGPGVANLLFWPLTILWDPISGLNGAQTTNYAATKIRVARLKEDAIDDLDTQLAASEITPKEYGLARRKIEKKYKAF